MATLLNAVTSNTTGDRKRVVGPCSVFVEGTLDGSIALSASRESDSALVLVETITAVGVYQDNIIGPHYLQATLSGETSSNVSVVTGGT